MAKYPFAEIESKWQKYWEEHKTFKAAEDPAFPREKRRYVLDMFPYPSAQGLHVGHPEGYTATDIYCRYLRARGFNVLHPMGFDAFGLPAENYAIKTGTHPAAATAANIAKFRSQIKALGFSYDWDREVDTSDPAYYRWTQWIFLKLFEKGLAYEAESPINFCPSCKTGLANEEVKDGLCERCGTRVTRKRIRQWILRITAYAERLLSGLDDLDWPEPVKLMQRNWIGRSEGANVSFAIDGHEDTLEIYTTRPDTLFGATYMVLAPEHPLVATITTEEQKAAVKAYLDASAKKSDLERTDLAREKTGVFSGAYAVNPVNEEKIPVWIADYVLISYGTGAIMAVPAHDGRDWDFAGVFKLPVLQVVSLAPPGGAEAARAETADKGPAGVSTEEGWLVNSGRFSGLSTSEAREKITAWLEERGHGKHAVNYKLRDWIFSRQRYWGEPIPVVHCPRCGAESGSPIVPLPESELPLRLPETSSYVPAGTGESPLSLIDGWVNTVCPRCGGPAKRETNTMPQWAGSCWYYLRYLDNTNGKAFAARDNIDYWAPVDLYVGGVEHAVLHLLYSRFWHKVLYDLGLVNTDEPFRRLVNQGMILGEDNQKMSKSRGNVINPDDIVQEYGADSMRVYEMFMGPLEVTKPWLTSGLTGVSRFLDRLWSIGEKAVSSPEDAAVSSGNLPPWHEKLAPLLHKTIKKVSRDTESLDFNTAISQMMIYSAELAKLDRVPLSLWEPLVIMLSAYAPHLGEELWEHLGHGESVSKAAWPAWDEKLTEDKEAVIVVQVNGKIRDKFAAAAETGKEALEKTALLMPGVLKWTAGKSIVKIVTVPGRLVNIVVKP
ncbi:MAG: leucine--tRNA ligase [Treponema sp.]|jgi:leucyl-tRNA synthetase|nr:leucine--tRNA ligase [Treponema sp.]